MKKILLLNVLSMLISVSMLAAPETLSMTGTANNEGASLTMKQKDANNFELFTSLKTGNVTFDDGSITAIPVTVEGTAPYCIRVSYDEGTPVVQVMQVKSVYLWAPWGDYTIGELTYDSNSTFKGEKFLVDLGKWGDDRYRIRIVMDNNGEELLETYGNGYGADDRPTDEQDPSYYELSFLDSNEKWPDPDKKYKIATKYIEKYIDVEVVLNPSAVYTHVISQHIIVTDLTLVEQLQLEGSALNQTATCLKKEDGVFMFVGELKEGTFKLKGSKDGMTYYFSVADDKLVETEGDFTVTGDARVYFIKVDLTLETMQMSAVSSCYLNYGSGGEDDRIYFTYSGNGRYDANALINFPIAAWGRLDERYKFRLELEDNTTTHWGYSQIDAVNPEGTMGGDYYKLYSVTNDNWDNSFKFLESTAGKVVELQVNFASDGNYYHAYQLHVSSLNDADAATAQVYPTMTEDELTVALDGEFTVDVISLTGVPVYKTSGFNQVTISLAEQNKGIYIVKISQNGVSVKAQRIVKL